MGKCLFCDSLVSQLVCDPCLGAIFARGRGIASDPPPEHFSSPDMDEPVQPQDLGVVDDLELEDSEDVDDSEDEDEEAEEAVWLERRYVGRMPD